MTLGPNWLARKVSAEQHLKEVVPWQQRHSRTTGGSATNATHSGGTAGPTTGTVPLEVRTKGREAGTSSSLLTPLTAWEEACRSMMAQNCTLWMTEPPSVSGPNSHNPFEDSDARR